MKKTAAVGREAGSRAKRDALTAQIAGALLASGVAQIPLRDLAAMLGTSDRMLLYYFDNKADLVRSSLQEISVRLAAKLEMSALGKKSTPDELLRTAIPLFASRPMAPFMNVWADIVARGGRGEEPFRTIARFTVERWIGWLVDRLEPVKKTDRRDVAAAILTVIEGARLLETSVPGVTQGATTILSRSFLATRQRRS
jgi:AcrR family transcriptional regulator